MIGRTSMISPSSSSRPTAPTSGCGASSSCSATSCPTSSARCSRRGSGTTRASCSCPSRRPKSGSSSPAPGRPLRTARRSGRAHRAVPGRSEEARLAVPLVGLDEVIGILLVRSSVTEYSEEHLRALSVIAAKLAAYITIRARAPISRSSPASATRHAAPSRLPATRKTSSWSWCRRSSGRLSRRSARARSSELEQKIQAQAQRLDDLLGQARLASAELRLTLRRIAPALEDDDSSSPDDWKRRGQLG